MLAKLRIWSFKHSVHISCSLLVNPSHTDESWAGQNTCMLLRFDGRFDESRFDGKTTKKLNKIVICLFLESETLYILKVLIISRF